ncbi:MAG: hypothetical protein JO222_13295 [Frankiales bacterium]|nr:hypothetical protein [Frankiales bacterium]
MPDEIDQLAGGAGRWSTRRRWAAAVLALLLVTVVVGVRLAGHRHPAAAPALPPPVAPLPSDIRPPTSVPGSVFIEHLAGCTTTDHRHRLTLAFAVTNLGRRPLQLVAATPHVLGGTLLLDQVRIGAGPCAAVGDDRPRRLQSAGTAVVAMSFRLGLGCPHDASVLARMTFRRSGLLLHADSAQLADLSAISFQQCPRPG